MEKWTPWRPSTAWSPVYGVLGTVGFNLAWATLMLLFWVSIGHVPGQNQVLPFIGILPTLAVKYGLTVSFSAMLINGCIIAPLLEETAFRWLPWRLLARGPDGTARRVWPMVLISGVVFGLAHGQGIISLTIQGVAGMLFAVLWFRNGPNPRTSFWSCVAAHSLYNFVVITLALLYQ